MGAVVGPYGLGIGSSFGLGVAGGLGSALGAVGAVGVSTRAYAGAFLGVLTAPTDPLKRLVPATALPAEETTFPAGPATNPAAANPTSAAVTLEKSPVAIAEVMFSPSKKLEMGVVTLVIGAGVETALTVGLVPVIGLV